MGKLFTITEGLENMGALKTGGQGSVYKGRRTGSIITAVKILPTPIHSESADDKNFADFQNEVRKLKKVAEQPSPNVVKILSSGITETGNLPFIEMEFIEGPRSGGAYKTTARSCLYHKRNGQGCRTVSACAGALP
jgi:serine/threonine-protein kinase